MSSTTIRRRATALLRYAFVLVAAGLLVAALVSQWDSFVATVRTLEPSTIGLSLLLGLVALVANMLSWRSAMASVGVGLSTTAGGQVFFLSQLGKYVPGSVWPVLAQMELARGLGHARSRGAAGSLLAMVVGVVSAAVVAMTALVSASPDTTTQYWWVAIPVAAGVVALTPPVLTRLLRLARRVLRRDLDVPPVRGRSIVMSLVWSVLMWAAFGTHAWVVARDLGATGPRAFLTTVGAFALAWVVGFLVVIAPAGAGAREAALVLTMGGLLSRPDALALALVSRVVLTVADGLAALVVLPTARRLQAGAHVVDESGPVSPGL